MSREAVGGVGGGLSFVCQVVSPHRASSPGSAAVKGPVVTRNWRRRAVV